MKPDFSRISDDVVLGKNVKIYGFVNLYGCEVGDDSRIGVFVEIQKQAVIGKRVKVQSHSFICSGVVIEDEAFIGHGVMFINDLFPRSTREDGAPQDERDWTCVPTRIGRRASIGSNATILCGVTVGECALVGAGAVVTKDVPPHAVVAGNPARIVRYLSDKASMGSEVTASAKIPFADLAGLHAPLKSELMAIVEKSIDTASFVGGPMVATFEKEFAEFVGASACSLVSSCTDALRLALIAAGVGPGSMVYTVPNTFIATAESIVQAGAEIRFVDVEPDTSLMSVRLLAQELKNYTRRPGIVDAIVPVHLYGQCADMDPINALAEEKGLIVIEDAAQAHGATYKDRRAGTLGLAAAFSFYPGKNLGACGEGGAVTTNDADLCSRISILRDHGQVSKANHVYVGYNGRLDAIQAGFLSVKLRKLPEWNAERQRISQDYDAAFADHPKIRPVAMRQHNSSSRHLYVVHVRARDRVMHDMEAQGIGVALHYPKPIHLQACFQGLGLGEGSFPVSEQLANELLSLPLFPGMGSSLVDRVVEALKDCVK